MTMLVPTCPNCEKTFTKDSSVTCHLSQPQTSCHSSIQDIINISQFAEVELPSCHTSPQANPEEQADSMHNSDNQVHANFDINFNFINDGFRVAEGSLEEQYEGARICDSQDGQAFLDVFDAHEYADIGRTTFSTLSHPRKSGKLVILFFVHPLVWQ
ncbi:hypothetical protein BDR06DRAFT_967499 [Suillus hirtellus]|nr:hypothetical protein BDR06DRAFT_967499 [Suillus hirtellus]